MYSFLLILILSLVPCSNQVPFPDPPEGMPRATLLEADTLFTVTDPDLDQSFGSAVCALGDVDGDGLPDFAAGDPDPQSNHFHGVDIISGGTGEVLHALRSLAFARKFGEALSPLPDHDGDNLTDLVVGAPLYGPHVTIEEPFVELVSSATGAALLTLTMPGPVQDGRFTFGQTVAGIADLNGDSVPDVLVGAISDDALVPYSMAGAVYALSGADGSQLYKVNGMVTGGSLGAALAVLGDLDNDTFPDFAVGAPGEGRVHIISGNRGTSLGTIGGPTGSKWFGSALANVGKVDGDNVTDLAVGDYFLSAKAGAVYLYSLEPTLLGLPPVVLQSHTGSSSGTAMGRSVAATGDVNGDSIPDFAVGSSHEGSSGGPGEVDIFSGANGDTLYHADGPLPGPFGSRFGTSVAGPGDMNGDGAMDLVVGEPAPAVVHVLSTGGPWENLGKGLAGTAGVPQLIGQGTLTASQPVAWHLKEGLPGATAWLVVGFTLLDLPFMGGWLVPAPDLLFAAPLDSDGHLHFPGIMPAATPAGVELFFQFWIADPGAPFGFAGSNGLTGTTG